VSDAAAVCECLDPRPELEGGAAAILRSSTSSWRNAGSIRSPASMNSSRFAHAIGRPRTADTV
jgi:hypothetical protein